MRGKNINFKTVGNMWSMLERQELELTNTIWDGDQLTKPVERKLSIVKEIESEFEETNSNLTNSNILKNNN